MVTSDSAFVSVAHGEPGTLAFGDIAFDSSGLLYMTGAIWDQNTGYKRSVSGTVDPTTGTFTEIGSSIYWGGAKLLSDPMEHSMATVPEPGIFIQ